MDPIGSNPDHAPYCDNDGWLLPMDQWPEHSSPKGTNMETPQQNTKREICTITFISDESQHIDVIVTSHPNGNDLEKLAKSVLEALQALMQRNDPQHKETLNAAHFDRG